MSSNIFLLVSSILLLGFILGRVLKKLGLTEVLAYIFAGIIMGPILHFKAPANFDSITTGIALSLVGYMVGLTFSFGFFKKAGRKISIILIVEVLITSICVWAFTYLFTKNLPLSIILGSLAPATDPAGTIAVLRDLKARGTLTTTSIAIVGLDDAAAIIIYAIGMVWTKAVLGSGFTFGLAIWHPIKEIFGALLLGGGIGFIFSRLVTQKSALSSDKIFTVGIGVAILSWGLAKMIGVSSILTCMTLGMTVTNLNPYIGDYSKKLIDGIMTPVFILFFAAVGMQVNFANLSSIWLVVIVYCAGRTVGKLIGCRLGATLAKSEQKIRKYLGIALLNQAGVAVGLAFLAAQELSGYALGGKIITLMATTTALFQILAPLGTQYAVKKTGEANL